MSHQSLHRARPGVALILRHVAVAVVPMLPGIAKMRPQHQLVEFFRTRISEYRIFQFSRSISFFKQETQRVFRCFLSQTAVTAMDFHAAIRRHVMILRSSEQLHGNGAFPSSSRAITHRSSSVDIDAAGVFGVFVTEEIVGIGYNRQGWDGSKPFLDRARQLRVACHLRIHLIVSDSSSPQLAIVAPCGRISSRICRLLHHLVSKQVGGGCHLIDFTFGIHSCGTQDGVVFDYLGSGPDFALRSRLCAVGGVTNFVGFWLVGVNH